MSVPEEAKPAKPVVGFFLNDTSLIEEIMDRLCELFGPPDLISRWMPFDYTSYYEPEMGESLFRRVVAFKYLIRQEDIARIKLRTNEVESRFSRDGRRRVNIDPGYLVHERFVLASGKNFTHRIYIEKGIYADLTLIFQKGEFRTLPWTYPDYADLPMRIFLNRVREKYKVDYKRYQENVYTIKGFV